MAYEIALDGVLTAFPNDEDGRDPLELTVHILSPEGFQIRGEALRRPPMSEEEKAERKARRLVLYVTLPPEMMNVRPEVHASRYLSRPRSRLTVQGTLPVRRLELLSGLRRQAEALAQLLRPPQ